MLYSRQFFIHAFENAVLKFVVDDVRDAAATKIEVTLIAPNKKTLSQTVFGVRSLLLIARRDVGFFGYGIAKSGLSELDTELVNAFLN